MSSRLTRPTLSYLLAARRCELVGLESLAGTCELVTLVCDLVHALQKERGYSNLYLCGGDGVEHALPPALAALRGDACDVEKDLRAFLARREQNDVHATDKARLLQCIAYGLFRLDALPGLRWRIRERRIDAEHASAAFTRLIGSLLAIVFEAADSALDPDVARTLVALLNFMQGKELSGQERAYGVMGFTAGYFIPAQKARMRGFEESQQRSFDVFAQYAHEDALRAWRDVERGGAQIAQMRGIAQRTEPSLPVDHALAQLWYGICTERIDAMRGVERRLADGLAAQCRRRIDEARAELDNHRLLLSRFEGHADGDSPALLFNVQARLLDALPPDGIGSEMERSLLDLLREQALRTQHSEDALADARSALDERRRIEKAKWMLVSRRGLSEQAAHDRLLRVAMDCGLPLGEVASQVLGAQAGAAATTGIAAHEAAEAVAAERTRADGATR